MRRLTAIITILASVTIIFFIWQEYAYRDKIHAGITIDGLDVSGLTPKQAEYRLLRLPGTPKYLSLTFKNYHEILNLSDFGAVPDRGLALANAYKIGRDSGWWNNLVLIAGCRLRSKNILIGFRLDVRKLSRRIKAVTVRINQPAVNAARLVSGAQIKIEPEQPGYALNIVNSINRIHKALSQNLKSAHLAVTVAEPEVTADSLRRQRIETLMSEFVTALDPNQEARTTNIKIAAQQIDGFLVPPGKIFSFNDAVGARSAKRGYKTATVIEDGNLAQGIGGGICQVATTIYNAYMLAGLLTVERDIHSNFIAAYPTGRDASVAEGVYDLKFKNDTGGFILIKALLDEGRLTIRLYGPKTGRVNFFGNPDISNITPYRVRLEPDNTLPPGVNVLVQKGVPGKIIKIHRLVKIKNQIFFEEEITSRYQARDEIIKTGPAENPAIKN